MTHKRSIFFIILAIGFLGAGGWWWQTDGQYRGVSFVPGDPDISSPGEYTRYYEALKRAYEKDTYGGETPDETLALFIDALKKGDIDLASKYFVVEKQEEKKNEFLDAKDNLSWYLDILGQEKEFHYNETFNSYEVRTQYENEDIFLFTLVLNTKTNKWKIYEL